MEWETLTAKQQEAVLKLLAEAADEIADQYEAELTRLRQSAAKGSMLARRDGQGLARQPVPPVPDVTGDGAYEKLVLDTHRSATYLTYLAALQAHLSVKGVDVGVGMDEYLQDRTAGIAEPEGKAFARVLHLTARDAYLRLYTRAITVFPERAMERFLEWDETARQQDSWFEKLRRMLGEP
jgi:hypothetical protein